MEYEGSRMGNVYKREFTPEAVKQACDDTTVACRNCVLYRLMGLDRIAGCPVREREVTVIWEES